MKEKQLLRFRYRVLVRGEKWVNVATEKGRTTMTEDRSDEDLRRPARRCGPGQTTAGQRGTREREL